MARVRTLSDLGRRQPWSGWEQRLLGAEPVCEPGAKFEGPTSGRKRRGAGGICVSTLRPGLWAASSLCVFCGLSSRSRSPSWWLSGLTFQNPSSKSVFVPLALRGPTSRVLSASVRQCSVGWSLTSQTSPRLPRKIPWSSHQVLWILHQDLLKVVTFTDGVEGVVPPRAAYAELLRRPLS